MCINVCACVSVYVYIYIYILYRCIFVCICTQHMHTCAFAYVYVYVYAYVYIFRFPSEEAWTPEFATLGSGPKLNMEHDFECLCHPKPKGTILRGPNLKPGTMFGVFQLESEILMCMWASVPPSQAYLRAAFAAQAPAQKQEQLGRQASETPAHLEAPRTFLVYTWALQE